MYKDRRNANFHLSFFLRHRQIFWPIFLPSIAIFFLTFSPQIAHTFQIENPDRTLAKLSTSEIQLTTTLTVPLQSSSEDFFRHILYVISLDGKITAIDAQANGRQLWTADTGAALVDSSLSKIEISRDSRSVRLIPSLIGGLFEKYDEDGRVEPLPFDADALLDASFKLHEELVITGGKHIDTLGLDLQTGQILYSFAKDDSSNTVDKNRTTTTKTNENNEQRSTLIVKRTTQTVRARSARNGYEKWNFSVSNHDLFHLRTQSPSVLLSRMDDQIENDRKFSGYFEYQLQTGVVLAFNQTGHPIWTSAIHSPIAAVWELKNGELVEKSLFETTITNKDSGEEEQEENNSIPHASRRLAFIGEFNSTPYVLVSPRVQKQLILDARKNNVAGTISDRGPVLSSWHKAYQKRTLSIGYENDHSRILSSSSPSESKYPLALRPDPTVNPHSHLSSIVETCDTAGYLELISNSNDLLINDESSKHFNTHVNIYTLSNTLTKMTIVVGALIIILFAIFKQRQTLVFLSKQNSISTDSTVSIHLTPPPTPEYHQIEQPLTPTFQSRYTLEYEHVRFLGRGGFGVVFEAINKLDERRVAIKRVSLKKASGKERALKEIRYLAVLNHPNLIQYYYAWNESPPIGWQEEEDKKLLVRNNITTRDSMSTFPTSANDSESLKSSRLSSISAVQPQKTAPVSLFEITFDRSTNPLLINEDFSSISINQEFSISSSSSSSSNSRIDANNNTKHSLSSSSPLFDHSSSSDFSNDKQQSIRKDPTESDDGIVFLDEDKRSSSPISNETKSLIEKKSDKDMPSVYFYFVMELCQPESLRDRLIQRKIDRYQAWSIFDQIVQGIEYIHSKKLIHRDLKPSNILFSMDNTVKIGDFGLVSAFGEDKLTKNIKRDEEKFDQIETMSTTTDGGRGNHELGGTMLYMSPEQIHREPYNQKVDIYAMGIILFELLYPFSTQMERMQSIANVRLQTPVFPHDFERETNNRNQLICRLIRWLLSYSPRDRPKSSELHQDTFYQRILQMEVPHLFSPDLVRQQTQTMINGQDQLPICHQRARISSSSSSPFRRTVSSSALQSHRESDSGEIE